MARGYGFLALEYVQSAVPPNGSAVLCSLAAPVKHVGKDAAGHIFHDFALKQSGLLGALLGRFWRETSLPVSMANLQFIYSLDRWLLTIAK